LKSIIQSVLGKSFQMRMVRIRDKTGIEPTILVFDAKYPWCIVSLTRVTSMLVRDVGDKFEMLVTDLMHWKNHQHNEKSRQHIDSGTNISNQSPT